jgi:hypothetical protein
VSYTTKGPRGSQLLRANDANACGYPITYALGTPSLSWVSLDTTTNTVSWQTNDLTLAAGTFSAPLVATFGQVPPVTITSTLRIVLTQCQHSATFTIPPVTYTVKDVQATQSVQATETLCGYTITYSQGTTWKSWVTLTGQTLSWYTTDATLLAGTYTSQVVATLSTQPASTVTADFRVNLQLCRSVNTFPITSPVSYTVKGAQRSQVLAATDSCGYTITYSQGTPSISWVSVTGSTVSW